jgi:predicted transcriptional regulator
MESMIMPKVNKDRALQTRIPSDLDDLLNLIAKANNKSKSVVVREALEAAVAVAGNDRETLLEKLRQRHREEERALGFFSDD